MALEWPLNGPAVGLHGLPTEGMLEQCGLGLFRERDTVCYIRRGARGVPSHS